MLITKPIIYRGHEIEYDKLGNGSKLPLVFECEMCHRHFKTTKYQIVRNGHEYCQQCALKLKLSKSLPVGEKYGRLTVVKPAPKSGWSLCACDCGNTVTVNNWFLKSGHTLSCGCLQKEAALRNIEKAHLTGEKHPNWKGGISSEWSRFTSKAEYKAFRNSVILRDGCMCKKCGSPNCLQVHHIHSFSTAPDDRMSLNNAVTLCKQCHEEFHRTYGKKHNNSEQLNEFLKLELTR